MTKDRMVRVGVAGGAALSLVGLATVGVSANTPTTTTTTAPTTITMTITIQSPDMAELIAAQIAQLQAEQAAELAAEQPDLETTATKTETETEDTDEDDADEQGDVESSEKKAPETTTKPVVITVQRSGEHESTGGHDD